MSSELSPGEIYDLLVRDKNYAESALRLQQLVATLAPNAKSWLDVGCGSGRHLEILSVYFDAEGLDIEPSMLVVAGRRAPNARLHLGSFLTFRLKGKFDVISCLAGSIGYVRDDRELGQAIANITSHLEEGGLFFLEPWLTSDAFIAGKLVLDVHRSEKVSVARMYITRRERSSSVYDITYLVGDESGVRTFPEHHRLSLFSTQEYRSALVEAGLELIEVASDGFGYGLLVGRLIHRGELGVSKKV